MIRNSRCSITRPKGSSGGEPCAHHDSRMRRKTKKPRIAIVDDDVSLCRALKRLLLTCGINAETFTSGREFLEVVNEIPSFAPECVILDMEMPGLDGVQVQARLASMRPHIPVIFLSGGSDALRRQRALALGAVAFFEKPLHQELELLVKTLQMLLDVDGAGHA